MANEDKFSGKAAVYAQYRPGYPEGYLDDLEKRCALGAHSEIAEIGAGTGILTAQLLERGFRVTAVEPNAEMRAAALARLARYPRCTVREGTAEATGLPDAGVDLVIAAQAFHWFDPDAFGAECRRILRPGGVVSLVWNHREENAPLTEELGALCRRLCPGFSGFSGGRAGEEEVFRRFFRGGVYRRAEFSHPLWMDREAFVGRMLSASYAPQPGSRGYISFCAELERLFARYEQRGRVRMENRTRSYLGAV